MRSYLAILRERACPLMRGAAEFCLDWLVEDGHSHLVTAKVPSGLEIFHVPTRT